MLSPQRSVDTFISVSIEDCKGSLIWSRLKENVNEVGNDLSLNLSSQFLMAERLVVLLK